MMYICHTTSIKEAFDCLFSLNQSILNYLYELWFVFKY